MTFHDARRLDEGTVLTADVCVVGAGAAGITIADTLAGSNINVCLLESGGFEQSDAQQALYEGERTGIPYPPLDDMRLRYFGGTTNHWAGWCRPPRPEDLSERPWLPGSGWPLSMAELEPYLRRAQAICDLDPPGFEVERWLGPGERPLPLSPAVFRTSVTRFSPPTRFADKFRPALERSRNIDVWMHANVVSLNESENGRLIDRLHCRTLEGNGFTVQSRLVVLATGGIENARLLLASRRRRRRGVGDENNNVGRFFMDHFKFHLGTIAPAPGVSLGFYQRARRKGAELKGVVGFTEAALRRHRITPAHIEFHPAGQTGNRVTHRVDIRLDPAPNPDSRIMLDWTTDRLGMRRVIIDLRFSAIEQRTFSITASLLKAGIEQAGIGVLDTDWDTGDPPLLDAARMTATGFHHMGATRMSNEPATGVVDRNCRVHSVANLYIAGCSVFPGYEGYPTMTLVALAARLADHLRSELS